MKPDYLNRRAALIGLASACSFNALAQSTPKVLCGFPAGGPVDLLSRLVAEELSKDSGKNFVVENRTGAGGAIAMRSFATTPADGSTFLVAPSSNVVVYPHTVAKPGYDALSDLVPVAYIGGYSIGFGVKADARMTDLAAYIELAKKDGKLSTFGSPGAGSLPHFYGLKVAEATGLNLVFVPYRGAGQAMLDAMGGVLGAVVTPVGQMLEQKNAGNIRILASSAKQRGTRAADVPTFAELGYPDLSVTGWYGLFAPKGTPAAEVQRVNQMLTRAFVRPEIRTRLAAVDVDPSTVTPAAFGTEIAAEFRYWEKVVRASGFKGEG